MAARSIVLLLGSSLGQAHDAAADNVDIALAGQTPDGYGTFLESFGTADLEWPARQVLSGSIAYAAAEAAKAQIGEEGNGPESGDTDLIGILDLDHIRGKLNEDDRGRQINLNITIPGYVHKAPTSTMASQMIRYLTDFISVRLKGEIVETIADNRKEQYLEYENEIRTSLVRLAQEDGLNKATRAMNAIQRQLTNQVKLTDERAKELFQAHSEILAMRAQFEEMLRSEVKSIPFGRRNRIIAAANRLLEVANRAAEIYVQYLVEEALKDLLLDLEKLTSKLLSQASSAINRLAISAEDLTRKSSRAFAAAAKNKIGRISLADPMYVEELIERIQPDPYQILAIALEGRHHGPLEWSELPVDEICAMLQTAATPVFEDLKTLTIEDVISKRANEKSPQARLSELIDGARSAWNLDLTRMENGADAIVNSVVVGVPDAANSIFTGLGYQLVSTDDPERITVLSVSSGAPITALQQWPEHERAYSSAKAVRPLHVMPSFQRDPSEARLAFALGEALGMIKARGSHYYYDNGDDLSEPVALGQGLFNAVHYVIAQDELVEGITHKVRQIQRKLGDNRLIEILQNYVEQHINPGSTNETLKRGLRQHVRDYIDELEFTASIDWDSDGEAPTLIEVVS